MPEQGVITGMKVQWRVTVMDDGWFDGGTDGDGGSGNLRLRELVALGLRPLSTGHWTLRPHGSQSLN